MKRLKAEERLFNAIMGGLVAAILVFEFGVLALAIIWHLNN